MAFLSTKDIYLGLKIIGVALIAVKTVQEFKDNKMEFNEVGLKDLVKLATELSGKNKEG